jgi:hypothetical protein
MKIDHLAAEIALLSNEDLSSLAKELENDYPSRTYLLVTFLETAKIDKWERDYSEDPTE